MLLELQGYFLCEQLLIPGIFDFSSQCWLGITFPLGQSIREMYLSNLWMISYQGLLSFFEPAPKYCIHPNNSIEVLDFSDNCIGALILENSNVTEVWFSGFTNLRYLNLQNNKLPFSLSRNCNFPNLEVLLLGSNTIPFRACQDIKLPNMPSLRILDLADNEIENLPILIFSNLSYLQELNLSFNSLTKLDLKLPVSRQMRLLNVSGNKLTSLKYGFMQQLDKHIANLSVDMTNNPFTCRCDDIDFVTWVQTTKVNLVRRDDYFCYHANMGQTSIVNVDTDTLCLTCNPPIVRIVLGSSFGTLFLISLVLGIIFVYNKRWYLRYKLYILKYWLTKRQQQLGEQDDFSWDGFVVYSSEGRQWVHETLREELEVNRNFKLFIYMRDMLGGGALFDRILEGMEQCRKFILVLSPNFLASDCCLFEAYVAQYNLLAKRSWRDGGYQDLMRSHWLASQNWLLMYWTWKSVWSGQRIHMAGNFSGTN